MKSNFKTTQPNQTKIKTQTATKSNQIKSNQINTISNQHQLNTKSKPNQLKPSQS